MVGCLSENTIQELVSGTLFGDALAAARLHIETCADCRTLVVELARDSDLAALCDADTLQAQGEAAAPPRGPAGPAARTMAERFEIVRPLGRGGMGVVYEAIDRERGVRVALKTLQHVSADGLLRFKTEFRALQDVAHQNLVAFGELIEDGGQWWLTMELVEGQAFGEHVRPGGRLDEPRLRAALAQLAAGLRALHAHGLVHRDVKPHNVLVTAAGRVVLLDFGLVAGVAQSESNVVGTPAYMAPEQAMLEEVGPAADWYGVGALLYEALTGALPFAGAPLQVLVAKQHAPPRRPSELAHVPADLPADLEELCMQLLAIEPAVRLAAAAAAAALFTLDPGAAVAPRSPVRAAPGSAPGSAPTFVGRRDELALLGDAFAATRAGGEAIVLVQGESGIGKSALVERFVGDLRGATPELLVLAGRCYERETVPYKGVDGVVDALARHLRKLPEAEAAAVLPRRAGLLVQAFPVLGKVSALARLPADDVLDPVELRARAFTALRELLGRLAERRPVVVQIDDLQWADADSLELLASVMARPEAPPLLLVLTSRPPREATDGASTAAALARVRALSGLRLLELSPLPRAEAVALAERLFAESAAATATPASAAAVAAEAAGHPLFIDALVRHTAVRSAALPAGVPLRLSDALWGRIAELPATARQLLALTAVAGWPLPRGILSAAAALPAGELEPALDRLRHAHLVRAADHVRKGAIEPYHDRIREAVLEHLPPAQRKECHRALASALLAAAPAPDASLPPPSPREVMVEAAPHPPSSSDAWWAPEAVGVHLHAAGELEQAVRYMVQAADQAAAALAFDRAARLYRQALALHAESGASPGPLGDTREVLARLAGALVNAGHGAEAATVYFELAGRAQAAGEASLELRLRGADQLLRSGHRNEGRPALAAVLDELDLRSPSTRAGALVRLLWRRAQVRLRGIAAFTREGASGEASPRERLCLDACRVAWLTTDLPAEYLTRYQLLALKTPDPRSASLALTAEFMLTAVTGGARSRRMGRLVDALAAVAERSADPYVIGQTESARSFLDLSLGRWDRGREHGARAVEVLRERCLGASYETAIAAVHLLMCLFYQGALRDFVRELLPLLREAEERGDHFTLTTLHGGAVGLMSLIGDRPDAARREVERGIALRTDLETDVLLFAGQLSHAEIDLYEGNGAVAYRWSEQDWRRMLALPFGRIGFVRARALCLHGLAALAALRAGAREPRLVRAAARDARALCAMRMPWTRALARSLEAGVALATGGRAEARAALERAATELTAAGMSCHATLARRRVGELAGGSEGARMIAEADAWLLAQDVRAPERLARVYMPEVA
ncbi:MAG TPA: AAA family ATPase [Kofleriaceae bacterium]|nr:AAA family ATPase [Kofleriaceae bacterium]